MKHRTVSEAGWNMGEDTRPLEVIVGSLLEGRNSVRILEAGCGSLAHFTYPPNAYIVGVDISQEQLDKNNLIHEKILGDLQDDILPSSAFDLIICWDVLEHLPNPRRALQHFVSAVNVGGLILLASPNVLTVRGLLTKILPHWIHVLYYRYVVGLREAGLPGHYPFKSYHRFAIAPVAIKRFAKKNNLTVELLRYSNWEQPEHRFPSFAVIWGILNKIVSLLTFCQIGTDERKGFQILLRKNRPKGGEQK
jgi:SAM-dependent methyltransferase